MVMLIIGVLAAIAIPRFLGQKERAYIVSMRSDLRNLISAEEMYFSAGNGYAASLPLLTYGTSAGVTVSILSADSGGWSATAMHSGTSTTCGIFFGTGTDPMGGAAAGIASCR